MEDNAGNRKVVKLSEYIDALNGGKKPAQHRRSANQSELDKLYGAVRAVRSLKEPEMPEKDYPRRLAQLQKPYAKYLKRKWLTGAAAAAVLISLLFLFNSILPSGGTNAVYAMEQAYKDVKAYHGVLEITESNAIGERITQVKREVWADKEGRYYIRETDRAQKEFVTVNNGQKKWQIRPDQKQVYIFSAFPDPYQFTFELGAEVLEVKNALETKSAGEETISRRKADVLEITPDGGLPYRLWIDKETGLPLQRQSAMQNALQYKAAYTSVDFMDKIPEELISYQLPEGFQEIDSDPEQLVNNIGEASEIVGFMPRLPEKVPEGYSLMSIAAGVESKTVRLEYVHQEKGNTAPSSESASSGGKSRIKVLQGKVTCEFKPASTAILGSIDDHIAEIQSPVETSVGILSGGGAYAGITNITSIRWQQDGFEYAIVGEGSLDELKAFVNGFIQGTVEIPSETLDIAFKPKTEVPIDIKIEKNEQKSADAGHSPWKLDPVFVAQVFVSLKISPEGIVGDYPVKYEELTVVQNTGNSAIVEIGGKVSPIRKVYLKKLIRQDSTGIWTVVGYDPVS